MNDSVQRCAECGSELPRGTPKSLCPNCALRNILTSAPAETASLPRSFGDYELLEEIARGGMGIVYRARQKSLNRIVAVKLLLSGSLSGDDLLRRFKMEAVSAGSLHHPNIVAIHEVGVHEGQHFLVMDFVNGPNLSDLVRDQPLHGQRAAAYVKTIAEAIHAAHENGVLHRDLKPSNVLIDENGQPHVSDFGLARQMDRDSSLTLSGQVLGSPNYMPPEQAAALHQKVGRWSDVYGLGAILYHLLTGRPPFQGTTISDTVHQVLNNEATSPRLVNPDVPLDLETICLKCLEKDPEQRYQTAEELAVELGRFLCNESIEAMPIRGMERLARWCRRNPVVASLAAAVVVTALTGLIGWLLAKERAVAATAALAAKARADENAARETQQAAEMLVANNEFLLQQAFADTNNLRGPALLKALEEGIRKQPTNLVLWQAKSEVLIRAHQFDDALNDLSRGIELAINNASYRTQIAMLLTRSSLLRQMGRQKEADSDYSDAGLTNCLLNHIPLRDLQTKREMLDLSPFFQSRLSAFFTMLSTDGREAENTMRENVRRNTGVEFDLRGGLDTKAMRSRFRGLLAIRPTEALTGFAVNQRFARMHVLHSIWGSAAPNTKVGAFVLHYADGQTREIPILYGKHVRDVWIRDPRPPTGALVAWKGKSSGANKDSRGVQFFQATWENPRPEAEVRSIELAERSVNLIPILLAITLEKAEPGSTEYWITQAAQLEDRVDLAGAITLLGQAKAELPREPALWNFQGGMLERAGRSNDALQAYSEAINLALADVDAFQKDFTSALLRRLALLRSLGQIEEAGKDNCLLQRCPLRDPQTRSELIDLSAFYNGCLTNAWHGGIVGNDLHALPTGSQKLGAVEFDLRGVIQLASNELMGRFPGVYPTSVLGIPFKRKVTRLHFLHATCRPEAEGTEIASYRLNFADGQTAIFPIIYGEHVRDWFSVTDAQPVSRATIAWTGMNRASAEKRSSLSLFHMSIENPRPDVAIKSLDIVSAKTKCAPFVIAITVE